MIEIIIEETFPFIIHSYLFADNRRWDAVQFDNKISVYSFYLLLHHHHYHRTVPLWNGNENLKNKRGERRRRKKE